MISVMARNKGLAISAAALSCLALTLAVHAADPNTRDDIGATVLMHAAAFSSTDAVRVLLNGGADINAASNGGATALMWATGNAATVRLLLDRGAAVNAVTRDGISALVTAARRGNVEVMRLLLAGGADQKSPATQQVELLRIA